jgi:hypothetical protein
MNDHGITGRGQVDYTPRPGSTLPPAVTFRLASSWLNVSPTARTCRG